jgi:hypothetical protein
LRHRPPLSCSLAPKQSAAVNANELARKAADEIARDFKCGKDEVKIIGETGRAVNLTKR